MNNLLELNPFLFSELNGVGSSLINGINGNLSEASPDTSISKDVKRELVMLSLPAVGGQAIDPMVQLMETAYIGRLGKID